MILLVPALGGAAQSVPDEESIQSPVGVAGGAAMATELAKVARRANITLVKLAGISFTT